MSRQISEDFAVLVQFVKNYSLNNVEADAQYRASLKHGHSAYLSLLGMWSEIDRRLGLAPLPFLDRVFTNSDAAYDFLQECVSDVASSLFCCIHGAYKPGHMALRSSIENFVRSVVAPFDKDVLTLTSVFELFDRAKASAVFLNEDGKKAISTLQNSYRNLCKFSHSASLAHMEGVRSLQHFPTLDADVFSSWAKQVKAVTQAIAATMLSASPNLYVSAHFSIKDIIDPLITKEQRIRLMGG